MTGDNNDIDKFFNEQLGGHENPYREGAWEKLESMLDRSEKKAWLKVASKYLAASAISALILTSSVITYIASNEAETAGTTPTSVAAETSAPSDNLNNTNTENLQPTESIQEKTGNTQANVNPAFATDKAETKKQTFVKKQINKGLTENAQAATPALEPAKKTEEAAQPVETIATVYSRIDNPGSIASISKDFVVTVANNDAITVSDNAASVTNTLEQQKREKETRDAKKFKFGVLAGANFNRVVTTQDNGKDFGAGLFAGIFTQKSLSSRFLLSAEVNYMRSSSNRITRNVSQEFYFLYKQDVKYSITTRNIDMLQIPLAATYRLSSRHSFSAGIYGSFIVNAQSEVARNELSPSEKQNDTQQVNGVYNDLNVFNYGLLASYEFKLPKLYSFGIRYNRGLNHIMKDGTDRQPMSNFQLYLKLNLN